MTIICLLKMMEMKRLTIVFAMALLPLSVFAQDAAEAARYQQRYDNLVSKFGPAGVGVETVLNNWEKADSTSAAMLMGKFNYYFNKARSTQAIKLPAKKYLGQDPLIALKDSTGADVYYFEDPVFDDELFGQAVSAIDRAIKFHPIDMDYLFAKANAYLSYEKESPDMALDYLLQIVGLYKTKPNWKYEGKAVDDEFFTGAMQEYCYTFYTIASPRSYKAFKTLSETMSKQYPKEMIFVSNLGSYYLVAEQNYRKALKYYNTVLKKDPSNYLAMRNCALAARRQKDVKAEKKYLRMMLRYCPDTERSSTQARLDYLDRQ